MRWFVLALMSVLVCLSTSSADDKRSKIPALTFVGNYEGEIIHVDANSDQLTLKIVGIVPKWVPNNQSAQQLPRGALRNFQGQFGQGGGSYVPSEQVKDVNINLSPDVKVRLMYGPPVSGKTPASGSEEKEKQKANPDESKEGKASKESGESKEGADGEEKDMKKPASKVKTAPKKPKALTAKELAERDPDYKLGGNPGKKSQLSKGQIVRVAMGKNNDRVNPQIYAMVVYVVKEGK